MLTDLRIKNFKSWRDTEDIRLAPITVFFGANSAGKSSLLQFLLMLKQTSESSDRGRVLHFGDDYSLVDLGTFHDLIFQHDLKSKLEFGISWKLPKPLTFSNPLKRKSYQIQNNAFEAGVISEGDKQHVERLRYIGQGSSDGPISVELTAGGGTKVKEYKISSNGYELTRTQGRAWHHVSIEVVRNCIS